MFARFNKFLEDISDPVYLMDPEGQINHLNLSARRVLGVEEAGAPGIFSLSDCHPPWAESRIREEGIPNAIANGRWRGESALLTRDGVEVPVLQTISLQDGDDDAIARMTAVFKADKEKCFEQGRRVERFAQLETLIGLSKKVLAEKNREGVIQRVVAAACELTRGRFCVFCRVSEAEGVSMEAASEGCALDSEIAGEVCRLLASPAFLEAVRRRKSARLGSAELSLYLADASPPPDWRHPALQHLVFSRLREEAGESSAMMLVANTDNVPFRPEDEAILIHLAVFTGLMLNHLHAHQEASRRSREMESVFANLNEAVMVCNARGAPVVANPACIRSLGFDPLGSACEDIARRMRLSYLDGVRVSAEELPFARALQKESIMDERYYGYDVNERPRVYVISATPLYRDDEVSGAVMVWRDETDLERLTEQLISEQSALQTIIKSAPEGIVVVDRQCRVTMANPTAVKLYGRDIPLGQPLSGQAGLKMMYPDGTLYDSIDLPLTRSVFFGEKMIDQEMAVALPDGGLRYLLVNTTPIRNNTGEIIGGVGVSHDITQQRSEKVQLQKDKSLLERRVAERTAELEALVETLKGEIEERKRVEEQLRESRKDLRMLSRRTLEALEADKQVVAKELHDSIGASLAAIKFSLEDRLSRMKSVPREDVVSLEKLVSYLVYTIKETKRISASLRPTTLDDLGLMATIDWFCREFSLFYKNIEVTQEITIDESDLSEAMKIVIYRILQESMNNAAKHGNPSGIHFTLARENSAVQMSVKDNGCGFEPHSRLFANDPLSGHGIQGMRERAEICGGRFEIKSGQGEGTLILLELPF